MAIASGDIVTQLVTLGFDLREGVENEFEPINLTRNLAVKPRRQALTVRCNNFLESLPSIGFDRLVSGDAVPSEQRLDPVNVPCSLLDQALAFLMGAFGVFIRNARDPHHPADSPLATAIGDDRPDKRFEVNGARLEAAPPLRARPTGTTLDLQAGGVDEVTLDAGGSKTPMQPEALVTGFMTTNCSDGSAGGAVLLLAKLGDDAEKGLAIAAADLVPSRPIRQKVYSQQPATSASSPRWRRTHSAR